MSTDSPTPERVTLTDDERLELLSMIGLTEPHQYAVVENLLAAREAAVRAQIEDRLHDAADELGALIDEQHSAAANPDAWLRDSIARITGGDA